MDYSKKYLEEMFFFEQEPTALNLVFLFCYEYNLFPQDEFDGVFIEKHFLQTKFNWFCIKKGISASYCPQKIFSQFGKLGVNLTRLKDKSKSFYKVSANHLLNK